MKCTHRYQGLIVLAVTQSALATVITIIFIVNIEPLNSKAAVAFAIKNFRYFGLPMQLILLAFGNTIFALVLWIYGTYGLIAGLFASGASGSGVWCVLFIWGSVFGWENKELTEKVRRQREELRRKIFMNLSPFKEYAWIYRKCKRLKETFASVFCCQ